MIGVKFLQMNYLDADTLIKEVSKLCFIKMNLSLHSARNFFKTFHGPNKAQTGPPTYGLILGSFESQGDGPGPHGKW